MPKPTQPAAEIDANDEGIFEVADVVLTGIEHDKEMQELVALDGDPDFAFPTTDALFNLAANIGTEQDKRSYTEYRERYWFARVTLEAMYAENWLAGKIVDIPADDMVREWRKFSSTSSPDKIQEFKQYENDMRVEEKFHEALKWSRLYGGCGIILGLDESQAGPPDTPLDINSLGKDCLTHLTVVENERLVHAGAHISIDPTSPYFDEPEYFRLVTHPQLIHRSRIIMFNGLIMPHYPKRRQRLPYWGRSILGRVYEAMVNADMTSNGAAALVGEASNDVIKYKGLAALMLQPGGEEKIRKRFALMKLLKSVNNATLLDEEESFESHSQAFSGLGDLLDRFLAIIAGAADIPVTRLIGTAAKGLNATGEGELKNYYDQIAAQQKRRLSPGLRQLDKVMQRSLWGEEIDDWGFEWVSLFQLNPKDKSEMESNNAFRDNIYLEAGVIKPSIVAKELQEQGTYTNITAEDIIEVEEAEAQAKELEEKQIALNIAHPEMGMDEFGLDVGGESGRGAPAKGSVQKGSGKAKKAPKASDVAKSAMRNKAGAR